MKICHFSDSHLGFGANHPRRGKRGLTLRQEDIFNGFKQAIDRIIDIRPDLCIHAGDLFDSVRPTNRIMALAGEELHRLAEINSIPTVIISGNHDAPKQPYVGHALEVYRQIDNLHIACQSRLETFRFGNLTVHALPHCLTGELLQSELQKCRPDGDSAFNILVLHGVVAGMPEFSMADLGEQEIPRENFAGYDYVALGHYHNFSRITSKVFYAGSTERTSQSERDSAKGFVVVDMTPFRADFVKIESRSMVDVPVINVAGKRGDQVAAILNERLEAVQTSDKVVRVRVQGISVEALKTIPADILSGLKEKAYALDLRFEKEKDSSGDSGFGRTAIGRLDSAFVEFLHAVNLSGFDRQRLESDGLKYLSEEDK